MGIQASTSLINMKHTRHPSPRSSGTRQPTSLPGIPFSARRKTPSSSQIARQYISEHARRTGSNGAVAHPVGICSDDKHCLDRTETTGTGDTHLHLVMPLDIIHLSVNLLPLERLSQPAHVTTSILPA
ncbi:hypothetical protein PAXRUDRAFT_830645 [Paxillus rubicundulus Ve08.2h10]|uniref:Uncharacterized protein n=2 Tax=Paxillus rubicundulus Ve08.2h10 TaxID=930991 RepID=A0A0D0E3L0_9AGAM|nr:hypothetical protein PAXRUDRAFT_830645 [Paxillus rubicundulus Ve08.2h10]